MHTCSHCFSAENDPCKSTRITASSVPVKEDAEVGMGKSQVINIDEPQDIQKTGVRARLTPLKSTTEAPLPAKFIISEVGSYSVDMLWTNGNGTQKSCALLQRFEISCSRDGYVQHGSVCEAEAEASSKAQIVIGSVLGAIALVALSIGAWVSRNNRESLLPLLKSFLLNEAYLLVGTVVEIVDYWSTPA